MQNNRITAVFDNHAQAEQAINAIRQLGISDAQLSVVARHNDTGLVNGADFTNNDDNRVARGATAGAVTGALFGLAALAIPGVGPFITAGWLASALGITGGALASGAIVGGTSGAIAGAFSKAGYEEHEAHYYGQAVEGGGVLVAVETNGVDQYDKTRALMEHFGGRFAGATASAVGV